RLEVPGNRSAGYRLAPGVGNRLEPIRRGQAITAVPCCRINRVRVTIQIPPRLPGRREQEPGKSERTGDMGELTTRERVYAEQVFQLYRLSRPAYVGTLVTSSVLVFALWGVVSTSLLGAWLCALFALTGARFLLYRAYIALHPPETEARNWARRFVIGAGTTGLLWGVAGSVLYPAASVQHQFLVIFLIG